MAPEKILTPNLKKLVLHKLSIDAVPVNGGLGDAIAFLSDAKKIRNGVETASVWVKAAIQAIRNSAEPNPWKTASDEIIAAEILRQVEEKKKSRKLG